jgi:hypothetical protein
VIDALSCAPPDVAVVGAALVSCAHAPALPSKHDSQDFHGIRPPYSHLVLSERSARARITGLTRIVLVVEILKLIFYDSDGGEV